MVKHHKPDPHRIHNAKDETVNPPTPFRPSHGAPGASGARGADAAIEVLDAPCHLTFDEMRELPMHLALGFDVEGENS